MNRSRNMLAADPRRPDQEHRCCAGSGRHFNLSAHARHGRAVAGQAIKMVRSRHISAESANHLVQSHRFVFDRRNCTGLAIARKRRRIKEN
jgi:hypothetical protein